MNTLILLVIVALLFVALWVGMLVDRETADRRQRERRFRAEARAAAEAELARQIAMDRRTREHE